MSEKIWFIYITDHHEGPFTPEEVAEKISSGMASDQSLAWKDGMPEWVPLHTIPELKNATQTKAADAPLAITSGAVEPPSEGADFSLAELLSKTQSGIDLGNVVDEPLVTESGTSALSAFASKANAPAGRDPAPSEEVWTMKIGGQVSGLHSLNGLIQMAGDGDVPVDAMLWHTGWTDFVPVTSVSQIASARKPKKVGVGGTKTKLAAGTKTGTTKAPGFAPITADADIGDDRPTDPGIQTGGKQSKLKEILEKITGLFNKKKIATKVNTQSSITKQTTITKSGIGGQIGRKRDNSSSIKNIATGLGIAAVLVGGGAAYFFLFASPIPSSLDVLPDDLETMTELVKTPAEEAKKFHLAMARGTDENPADDTNPKIYIATNLPEGTRVKIKLIGVPGTVVNKLNFEKSFEAVVAKTHLATFEQISEDGKPLPMGEYQIKISADGTDGPEQKRFLGGKKGAVYDRRLKQYKDKLQADYDKEMEELRQYIGTLRSLHTELAKKSTDMKALTPAQKAKFTYEWKVYFPTNLAMVTSLDSKLKLRISSNDPQKYYPRAFQDINTTLGQITQFAQSIGTKVDGGTANPDDLDGLVQAGIVSLEQWLSTASLKTPFEALKANQAPAPTGAAPVAVPAATPAVPVTAPAAPTNK